MSPVIQAPDYLIALKTTINLKKWQDFLLCFHCIEGLLKVRTRKKTHSGSKRRLKLKKFSDAEPINASHRYQRQLLRHYMLWIVCPGMRPGEVHKLRYRHIMVRHIRDTGATTLRIKVPHDTERGARLVIALPAAVGVYQSLQQQTQHSGKQDYLRYAQSSGRSGAKSPGQPVCQRPVSRCLSRTGLSKFQLPADEGHHQLLGISRVGNELAICPGRIGRAADRFRYGTDCMVSSCWYAAGAGCRKPSGRNRRVGTNHFDALSQRG